MFCATPLVYVGVSVCAAKVTGARGVIFVVPNQGEIVEPNFPTHKGKFSNVFNTPRITAKHYTQFQTEQRRIPVCCIR